LAAETAKIVRFHRIGPPEVLQLDELPLSEPGHGEIRLRVKAIGLNRAETYFRQDRHPKFTPRLPSKIGFEASGIVEAVGPGVDPYWLGKTASTVPAFPANVYGVYGEIAIVPVSAVAEYPAHLSYEEGASIWMQYITAYGALVHEGKLRRGDFVIITAASSSVGIAAIETARLQGAISIATTRTARRRLNSSKRRTPSPRKPPAKVAMQCTLRLWDHGFHRGLNVMICGYLPRSTSGWT